MVSRGDGEAKRGWGGVVPAFSNCCARSFQLGWGKPDFGGGFLSLMVVAESSLSLKSFRTASFERVIVVGEGGGRGKMGGGVSKL